MDAGLKDATLTLVHKVEDGATPFNSVALETYISKVLPAGVLTNREFPYPSSGSYNGISARATSIAQLLLVESQLLVSVVAL